jgi:hypothetical protein
MSGKRRFRLKTSTMEKMVFIHANTRMMDKITDVCYEEEHLDWEVDSPSQSESETESESGDINDDPN